jgi:hypothetical protein
MTGPNAILMKSYGDLEISQTEDGDLRLQQEDSTSTNQAIVIVSKEQLAVLVAFIRQMQPEGTRT